MSTVHAVTLDYSPETGTIAACVCGLTLGPFNEYAEARSAAVEHRRWTGAEIISSEARGAGAGRRSGGAIVSPLKPEYARGRQSRTKPVTLAEAHAAADKLEARHRRIHERIMARVTGSGRERPGATGAVDPTLESRAAEVVAREAARRAAREGRR